METQVRGWRKEAKGAERTKKEVEKGDPRVNLEFAANAECPIKSGRLIVDKEAL